MEFTLNKFWKKKHSHTTYGGITILIPGSKMEMKTPARGCETDRPINKQSDNPFAFPLVRSQTIGDLRPSQKDKKNTALLDTLEEISESGGSTLKSKKPAFDTEPPINAPGGGEKSKSMTNLKREGSRVHFTKTVSSLSQNKEVEVESDNDNVSDAESDVFSHASSMPEKNKDPNLPQETVDLKRRLQRQRSIGSRRDIVFLR